MREPARLSEPLADEAATRAAGAQLARAALACGATRLYLTLAGELGAGKTTFVRGMLGALGIADLVRSPTYTLVESYAAGDLRVDHFDWYRISGSRELEDLEFREALGPGHWALVEWPERAPEAAEAADLAVKLSYAPAGRHLAIEARTATGRAVAERFIAVGT
jgi:tRNA threonylcarbamoyladenosine biosynthesis protein TsaE